MSETKKTRTLSPQEIARRKEAAERQALLNTLPPQKSFASAPGKGSKFAPKKSANFRHQGR